MSNTDKLLLIGWKGAERDFVNLLAKKLRKNVPTMIVSSSRESADKIRDTLMEGGLSTGGWNRAERGFADSVRLGRIESFIRES